MEVCNACRYCEGFCAVFPAMELRRDFSDGDLDYLANLCHNCQGCFHACQYAPPHPFGVNVPKALGDLRAQTYRDYAWPQPMARLFERNGALLCLVAALCVAVSVVGVMLLRDPTILFTSQTGPGAFYRIMPWGLMTGVASVTFLYALLALAMGFRNFWRASERPVSDLARARPLAQALHDVFTLKYLGGGGHGCNDVDDTFSMRRRRLHHAMFYGFLLCFASTSVATLYDHFLDWPAPYPFFSLPVLLGTFGGIGLVVGTAGLIWVKVLSDPTPAVKAMRGGEYALLTLLLLAAVTGCCCSRCARRAPWACSSPCISASSSPCSSPCPTASSSTDSTALEPSCASRSNARNRTRRPQPTDVGRRAAPALINT